MKKSIDISFSDQAETLIESSGIEREELVEFLIEAGGFTVGGNEVIAFLENKRE